MTCLAYIRRHAQTYHALLTRCRLLESSGMFTLDKGFFVRFENKEKKRKEKKKKKKSFTMRLG